MKYWITIEDAEYRKIYDGEAVNAAAAILVLQDLIKILRRPELPQFDASWGEAPLPIIAPSDEELAAYINHASGVT